VFIAQSFVYEDFVEISGMNKNNYYRQHFQQIITGFTWSKVSKNSCKIINIKPELNYQIGT